jgi:UDP:flavonoid glycosyltransferase YjiC (YdhE family)
MRIFYAVQATGNGHISRAMELLPELEKMGQVDIFSKRLKCKPAMFPPGKIQE